MRDFGRLKIVQNKNVKSKVESIVLKFCNFKDHINPIKTERFKNLLKSKFKPKTIIYYELKKKGIVEEKRARRLHIA